jgi:hypothetical protein
LKYLLNGNAFLDLQEQLKDMPHAFPNWNSIELFEKADGARILQYLLNYSN